MKGPVGEFGERFWQYLREPQRAIRRYFEVRGKCFSRQPRIPSSMESTLV